MFDDVTALARIGLAVCRRLLFKTDTFKISMSSCICARKLHEKFAYFLKSCWTV